MLTIFTRFPPYFFHKTIKGNRKGNKSNRNCKFLKLRKPLILKYKSGQQDLNLRPHGPQPCALPSYAIPRNKRNYIRNLSGMQLVFSQASSQMLISKKSHLIIKSDGIHITKFPAGAVNVVPHRNLRLRLRYA